MHSELDKHFTSAAILPTRDQITPGIFQTRRHPLAKAKTIVYSS